MNDGLRLWLHGFLSRGEPKFECPICAYVGPFKDVFPDTGRRRHAQCPKCRALERHRLQFVVLDRILKSRRTTDQRIIHFAPEPFLQRFFRERFGSYETADIDMKGVDHRVDLQTLPFADCSYDFVFASHVLEHVPDDGAALGEIRRILKPGGIAVLPVPIVCERTVEYPAPNPHEAFHVRAPGLDYFDRYERHFARVERFASDGFPEKHQLFVYEDRSRPDPKVSPLRPPMPGERHLDIVPVCHA